MTFNLSNRSQSESIVLLTRQSRLSKTESFLIDSPWELPKM
jgi:hypothetical protein